MASLWAKPMYLFQPALMGKNTSTSMRKHWINKDARNLTSYSQSASSNYTQWPQPEGLPQPRTVRGVPETCPLGLASAFPSHQAPPGKRGPNSLTGTYGQQSSESSDRSTAEHLCSKSDAQDRWPIKQQLHQQQCLLKIRKEFSGIHRCGYLNECHSNRQTAIVIPNKFPWVLKAFLS